MQDRFKFRVWNNTNKSFIKDFEYPIGSDYQLVLSQDGLLYELGLGDYDDFGETHSWGTLKPFSDVVIQQCTGLKDKNGTLIYEGDIIKIPDDWNMFGQFAGEIREIYYNEGFRLKPKWDKNLRGNWLEDTKDLEIVGNIYENHELMEEQQ